MKDNHSSERNNQSIDQPNSYLDSQAKQKGYFFPIIGVILIILVIGGGGYYLGNKSNKLEQTQNTASNQKNIPTIQSVTNAGQDETANWKVYQNSKVSFKYPPTWNIANSLTDGIIVSPNDLSNLQRGGGKWETIVVGFDQEVKDEYVSNSDKSVTSKTITVNKMQATEYTITYNIDLPGIHKGDVFTDTVINSNGKKYLVELLNPQYKNIYSKLLSSLKFSDQSQATTIPTKSTTQPTPTNPFITAKNPKWSDLKWIIVFTDVGEPLSEDIKTDLCTGTGVNKILYLKEWFKREAGKYGMSLSLSVNCYDKQVALPQDVITTTDTYSAFGKAIPLPLNMQKTRDYLAQTLPELLKYDLITVVHYFGSGAGMADQAIVGNKLSYIFIAKSKLFDGVQYYAPTVTEPNLDSDAGFVRGIAHEALHSLGASDHYDYNSHACSDEPDKKSYSKSVMCDANFNYLTDYFVSPQTAKEIGWTN